MHKITRITAVAIILLGILHISFAFPLQKNTDTLWFTGAGMAIIFAGLLNLVAIDRGGSVFTKTIALLANALMCLLFFFALPILNEPQIYFGIIIFFIPTIIFAIDLLKRNNKDQ